MVIFQKAQVQGTIF